MKIVVGLGNPGKEYEKTRHNVGFMVLDQLAEKLGLQFSASKKIFSEVAKKSSDILLVKPTTYMNLSGQAVRAVLDYYQVGSENDGYKDLFIVHDDLDLAFGTQKIQYGTGPKSHNGLLSVYDRLGTKQFWHVRIGVDNRGEHRLGIVPSEYVLKPFVTEEHPVVAEQVELSVTELVSRLE